MPVGMWSWKKKKCTLVQAVQPRGGSRGIALLFHDHGTRKGWGVSVTPRPLFTPGERPGTHCTGGWVGPRAGLDRCGKSRPPPRFDPRTVQPIASRYMDWSTRPTMWSVTQDKGEVSYAWGTSPHLTGGCEGGHGDGVNMAKRGKKTTAWLITKLSRFICLCKIS